jgi:hypothetical protein
MRKAFMFAGVDHRPRISVQVRHLERRGHRSAGLHVQARHTRPQA